MKKTIILLAALIFISFLSVTNAYAQTLPGGMQQISVPWTASGTSTEPALLSLPNDYNSTSQTYPLLVFFHGAGEAGTSLSKIYTSTTSGGPMYHIAQGTFPTSFTVNGQTSKFIVVAPQSSAWSTKASWIPYILTYLATNYRVDVNRIYLTGLSAGGEAVVGYPSHFDPETGSSFSVSYKAAATVPMSAATGTPSPSWGVNTVADNTHVWGFGSVNQDLHGENTQTYTTYVNNAGAGYARFTNYSGGHCCWNNFYNPSYTENIGGTNMNIYQWLLTNSLTGVTPPPAGNVAPTANAGLDQSTTATSVTLNGSGTDSDGTIASYAWVETAGAAVTITSPNAASTSITGLTTGSYTFRLTVTDNSGATATDTVNVTVTAASGGGGSSTGQSFLIDLGNTDQQTTTTGWNNVVTPTLGTSITLKDTTGTTTAATLTVSDAFVVGGTATFSANINGTTSGPYPSTATLDSYYISPNNTDTSAQVTISNLGSSAYTVKLYASRMASDTTNRTGVYTANGVSGELNATNNTTGVVTLANVVPVNGSIVINVALKSGATYAYLGVIDIQATAGSSNAAPTANAGTDKTITLPTSSVSLTGTGSDTDGTISSYAWSKISGGTATIASPTSASTNITGLAAGTYTFRLTVTDNGGATGTDDVVVTVNSATNASPTANAGSDQSITLPTSSVTLSGSGADTDGTIASYAWSKFSGGTATIASPSSASTSITGLSQGTYTFRLTVTDNGGATATDDVVVTVNAAPTGAKTITINPTATGEIYKTDLTSLNIQPGDTIAIPAGSYPNGITLGLNKGFAGTAENPVTIINSGGLVNAAYIRLYNMTYFRLTGTGTPGIQYGFKISNSTANAGVAIADGTSDYEDDHIEVTGTEVGLYQKIAPVAGDPLTQYPNWVIKNVKIHDNYIHDTHGEGMYIGHTYPSADPYNGNLTPVRMQNVKIYNNLVDGTDWDGIQLSNARDGAEIYGNTVKNFGRIDMGSQQAGIILGGNTTGTVHDNVIDTGTGNALELFGYGDITAYNNVIKNAPTTTLQGLQETVYMNDNGALTNIETNPAQHISFTNNIVTTATNSNTRSAILNARNNGTTIPGTISNNTICDANGKTLSVLVRSNAGDTMTGNTLNDSSCGTVVTPPVNNAPVVNAGIDASITLPTSSITLSGSATDSDGTISSYAWTKILGGTATIASPNSASTNITGLALGSYTFRLTATDNGGATSFDDILVTVNQAPNNPPSANAGADVTITLPTNTVTLNGSGTDSDGTISSYAWTKVSGQGTITSPSSASTSITGFTTAGTSVFHLTVTDNSGATATDSISVIVNPVPNSAPIVSAGTDVSITLPVASVTLSATATDPDADTMTYAWTKTSGGTATIASPTAKVTNVSSLAAGTYTFQFTATDSKGASTSDTIMVTVNAAIPVNNAPIVNAGVDKSITLPVASVTLTATATDPDNDTMTYSWTKVSGPATPTIGSASSLSTLISNLSAAGTYTFRFTATDSNAAASSDDITVTVNGAVVIPNNAPIVNAGVTQAITLPISTVSLLATATDPDGDTMTYGWAKTSGGTATITPTNALAATVTNLAAGTYTFTFTATDSKGAATSDTVTITVNAAIPVNVAPVVSAGAGQTITLPTNTVTLTGTAIDSDGTIATTVWSKVSGPTATITSPASLSTTVTSLLEGTYVFSLTATDNSGSTGTDSITITVNPQPTSSSGGGGGGGGGGGSSHGGGGGSTKGHGKPTAYAGTDVTIAAPIDSAVLVGSGDSIDGAVTYQWSKTSGSSGTIEYPTRSTTTVKGLKKGNYTFSLTTTDVYGETATDYVSVTVLDANTTQPVSVENNTATATTTVLSGPTAGNSSGPGSSRVRTSASKLNVRTTPVSGSVVAQVPAGTSGTLITSANGWYQVQFDSGVTGWVSSTYASVSASTAPVTSPASGTSGSGSGSATVTASRLNVRSSPVSGSVTTQVTAGTTLPILSTSGGWSQVQLPTGGTGWVSNAYLSGVTSTPAPSTPTTIPTTTPTIAPTATNTFSVLDAVTSTASSLNVRSTPNGSMLGKVPSGTKGTVISVSGSWAQVYFSTGLTGYVSMAYLSK